MQPISFEHTTQLPEETAVDTIEEYLKYARRVAYSMSQDPEMGSIAGLAAWQAYTSFDPEKQVPPERWVALVVRHSVWSYWRKLRVRAEVQKSDSWWESEVRTTDPTPSEIVIPPDDWVLLVESLIDRWPLDVIARRHEWSIYETRKRLNAAKARLGKSAGEEA